MLPLSTQFCTREKNAGQPLPLVTAAPPALLHHAEARAKAFLEVSGAALAIQKCKSLFPADKAAFFPGHSHHESKRDFRVDSVSIPFFRRWVYSLV